MGIDVGISRRTFMSNAIAGSMLLALPALACAQSKREALFFSAMADHGGDYYLAGFNLNGEIKLQIPVPGRGHAPVVSPDGSILIMIARRPGNWLVCVDRVLNEVQVIQGPIDRHYFGHGVFSKDGTKFYATENDFENKRGVVGVYETFNQFKRIGEFYSGGIGPHELLLSPDGEQLVVANGGILTHPDTGRSKLNLDSMSPSLTILSPRDGLILSQHRLPAKHHQLSIRHIDIAPDNTIGIGLQYQGKRTDLKPLVALRKPGEDIQLLDCPEPLLKRMKNYCGSVAMDVSGKVIAASAPRGGVISYWSTKDGKWLNSSNIDDGCGVVASGREGEFIISSGKGLISAYTPAQNGHPHLISEHRVRWDNHISR